MQSPRAPRAFISHASEDKDGFARQFAADLRAAGIEAWLDEWEIGPGDSLVQRIFDEGITEADAVIVLLSADSVQKPWVREELEVSVVARINSERTKKLISILLEPDVEVPVALSYLLWLSVPRDGAAEVTKKVIETMHGQSRRPPLGSPPAYSSVDCRWTAGPVDEAVFQLIVEEISSHGPNWLLFSDGVQARAESEFGISADQFRESMLALSAAHLVNVQAMVGDLRWIFRPFSHQTWLRLQADRGVDLAALRPRILSLILNQNRNTMTPEDVDTDAFTLGAILDEFQSQGLLRPSPTINGPFAIYGLSPLAARALRSL